MKNYSFYQEFCEEQGIKITKNALLKDYTTFRIGGPAFLLAEPQTETQLAALIKLLKQNETPYIIIGRGSNLLFSDKGYDGLVIHLGNNFSAISLIGDTTIECLSGTSLAELCKFALAHHLTGLEFAYGIPGTVGGAVYMNAGAYGGEIKDTLQRVFHLDEAGQSGYYDPDGLHMGYRHSVYNENSFVITKARFTLQTASPDEIQTKMNEYIGRRKEKQPLEFPSAGSVFRRPQGNYASALVDQCGLKGKRIGDAQVSEKHAGFIVNLGNATCKDVLQLIAYVQNCVKEKTGYQLDCEIKTIV